jgi:acetyltransferase
MIRTCFIDYDREMALVADYDNLQNEIIGVACFIKEQSTKSAEVAILIADQFQRQGLGTELLRRLIQIGREKNSCASLGTFLSKTRGCKRCVKKLGFRLQYSLED